MGGMKTDSVAGENMGPWMSDMEAKALGVEISAGRMFSDPLPAQLRQA